MPNTSVWGEGDKCGVERQTCELQAWWDLCCTNKTGRKKRSWHVEKEGLMTSRIKVVTGEVKNVMDGRWTPS